MPDEQRTPAPSFRWIVVFAAALLLAIAMGTLVNGLSAFLIPLEMHFGWDRAEVSAINSVGLIGIALGGIAMGFLADRVSTRAICMLGVTVLRVSCRRNVLVMDPDPKHITVHETGGTPTPTPL